jgi:hypothetical protein
MPKNKNPIPFLRIGSDQVETYKGNLNHPLNETALIYQNHDGKAIE